VDVDVPASSDEFVHDAAEQDLLPALLDRLPDHDQGHAAGSREFKDLPDDVGA
jgi:hypothetical protein